MSTGYLSLRKAKSISVDINPFTQPINLNGMRMDANVNPWITRWAGSLPLKQIFTADPDCKTVSAEFF